MSDEFIDISNCPKCYSAHRYKITVERSLVFKMLSMADIHERPRSVGVTRLFTCPVKNEEFQAQFVLTDTSSDRIKNVTVVGIAKEDEHE